MPAIPIGRLKPAAEPIYGLIYQRGDRVLIGLYGREVGIQSVEVDHIEKKILACALPVNINVSVVDFHLKMVGDHSGLCLIFHFYAIKAAEVAAYYHGHFDYG